MRRIGRWMINALTALSLLLCVGTCVLWLKSSIAMEYLEWTHSERVEEFKADGGEFFFADLSLRPEFRSYSKSALAERAAGAADDGYDGWFSSMDWRFAGINFRRGVYEAAYDIVKLSFPLWLLALASAALPGARLVMRVRRRRLRNSNLCACCRYDLTGNVSGVCPECGTTIAEAK